MGTNQFTNYTAILNELKHKISQARIRAVLSVNKELLQTYWDIGNVILQQQNNEGWGAKVIERLAKDLKVEFPDFQGISIRNFKYMRAFAEAYPHFPILQAPLAKLKKSNKKIGNQSSTIVQAPLAQLGKPGKRIKNKSSEIVQAPLAQLKKHNKTTDNQSSIIVQAPLVN